LDRKGCSSEERNRVLAKLQAIKERMSSGNDEEYSRKRAAPGERKRRRAKREKLDGDFTGSCMERIDYDNEEKPSLKRPEPKPEDPKPEKVKREKVRTERPVKEKREKHRKHDREGRHDRGGGHKSDRHGAYRSHSAEKSRNIFDAMKETKQKEKVKIKRRPMMPPPMNFADLMKMAEQKLAQPVMVEVKEKKKEKEHRPMTQDEIDRKRAREERVKTQEYKDWYKYGEKALKSGKSSESAAGGSGESAPSGGFLHKEHDVLPPNSGQSGRSNPNAASSKSDREPPSSSNMRPPSSSQQTSAYGPPKGFKPQPNPARPGTIANKPQAMAKHFNNGHKDREPGPSSRDREAPSASKARPPERPAPSRPGAEDKTRGGNAWDLLFNRPEYKKLSEPPGECPCV
jgi:protein SPT2